MKALNPSEFYLVLENYDTALPPQGICIVSGTTGSFNSPYYWTFDSTSKSISQQSATDSDPILDYFIAWDDLPDYTGDQSLVSKQTGLTPASRKYIIIPDQTITAARIYTSKTALTPTLPVWTNWLVTAAGDIPAFASDQSRLTGDAIIDKAEFTYSGKSLTINTTTVDFLSIPMTVEATFNVDAIWGNERGPIGITNDLKTVAAAFTAAGTVGGVDWSNLNSVSGTTTDRILSPFRYIPMASDQNDWNTYFDDYIAGLTTLYSNGGFQYPFLPLFQGAGYYIAKVRVNGSTWTVDAYDKTGTLKQSDLFTLDTTDLTGNGNDIFAVTETNDQKQAFYAALNRGVAHVNNDINGWITIFVPEYPTTESSPSGQWTPSQWANHKQYYLAGTLSSGQNAVCNVYSKLLHEQSIEGPQTNRTVSPFPTAINKQNYCYGFSIDDQWVHGSAVYGQGPNGNAGSTIAATVGIFAQS